MSLRNTDITSLIALFQKSGLREMHLRYEGDELFLSRDGGGSSPFGRADAAPQPAPAIPKAAEAAVSTPPPTGAASAPPVPVRDGWVPVKAANLGTFYRSSKPDAPPYVDIGTQVTPQTEICLIEVMKLFTTLTAGASGTVREILVKDGDMVEFDQILMWIEPGV